MYNFKTRETKAAQSKQVVANEDEAEPQMAQCFQNPFEVAPQLKMTCFIYILDSSLSSLFKF